jgi:hypothetical protein
MSPRNQKLSATICLTPLLLAAGAAQADLYGPGGPIVVPDNTPAGASSSIAAVNILNPTIFTFDSVVINVSVAHTWIGDLTVTLSHNGVDVQLFRRPGTSGIGSSGDWLVGVYTFATVGTAFPNTGNTVPGTTYAQTNNSASTQLVPPADPDTFAAFTGMDLNGTWTLTITDNASGDTATISSWSMNITSVPEPGTFALLGVMAAGAIGVRAWRKRKAA